MIGLLQFVHQQTDPVMGMAEWAVLEAVGSGLHRSTDLEPVARRRHSGTYAILVRLRTRGYITFEDRAVKDRRFAVAKLTPQGADLLRDVQIAFKFAFQPSTV